MSSIVMLKSGLNVQPILDQLLEHKDDWSAGVQGAQSLLDDKWGFPAVQAGVLQLKMGAISKPDEYVGDSELTIDTPLMKNHTAIFDILEEQGFKREWIDRCGFLSLPVGGQVGMHRDIGTYYQTRDRFHLSIQSSYVYEVGVNGCLIEPGSLFWFDNKEEHGTENVGEDIRITFVFDVPHKYRGEIACLQPYLDV